MKRWFLVIVLAAILTLSTVALVTANGDPVGGCPDSFQIHLAIEHDHDHTGSHKHVGNDQDLNADGWICGKHVGADGSVHVHIDNNVPLP